jgi:hypothetical protein
LKINFSGVLQRCVVCHDWIVLPSGQKPVKFCPYCGSNQTTQESGQESLRSQLKSTGDTVSNSDAALISLRLQQFRIKSGLAPGQSSKATTGSATESTVPSGGANDPYPAPGGDFSPTLKDIVGDHVLIGNVVLIAADLGFALLGLSSSAVFLEILVGIVATGTIVDTWVHEFFH